MVNFFIFIPINKYAIETSLLQAGVDKDFAYVLSNISNSVEEANKYIKIRDALKSESNDIVNITPPPPPTTTTPTKPTKPKRKCTEKQLAALAAGRAKNPRLMKKLNQENENKK